MTKLHQLYKFGQSIWYDNISFDLIKSGKLQDLLDSGVRGITSNPTIFDKAISDSTDYDEAIQALAAEGKSIDDIYQELTIRDIGHAADLLRTIYHHSNCQDGYVSLEVSPKLARDTEGTIEQARKLFAALDRPNIMIKVPATPEGIPAIKKLISEGININITLMFSIDHYDAVAEAYISGLEELVENGGDPSKVSSVASFFVSRVETSVDKALDAIETPEAQALKGKIAIANAKVAYERFKGTFRGNRWQKLAEAGAQLQRPLWASTGTKNPEYSDTLYIDGLIGPHTVNTVPPKTLEAFLIQGVVDETLDLGVIEAELQLHELAKVGVDLSAITEKLQDDGVEAFTKSFESLMTSIAKKQELLQVA